MSHTYYKDLCNELKYDLKRKKRDCEDLDDKLKREETESKRLKNENHDLWKLYYGLQQELQSAYERNSKLQVEKMTVEGLYERERHELEKLKNDSMSATQSAATLKDALCAMQNEKVSLQQKFNEMMSEIKKLKEREREVEPKLREFEEFKRRMIEFDQNLGSMYNALMEQKSDLKDAQLRKDQIETMRRHNAMLRQESEQKARRLQQWPALVRALHAMEQRLTDAETRHAAELEAVRQQSQSGDAWAQCARDTLPTFASQCQELRVQLNSVRQSLTDKVLGGEDQSSSSTSTMTETLAQRLAEYMLASEEQRANILVRQSQLSASNDSLTTCDEETFEEEDSNRPGNSDEKPSVDDVTASVSDVAMVVVADRPNSSSAGSAYDVTLVDSVDDDEDVLLLREASAPSDTEDPSSVMADDVDHLLDSDVTIDEESAGQSAMPKSDDDVIVVTETNFAA